MEDRIARVAENEVVFRGMNEDMAAWDAHRGDSRPHEFFCECGTPGCHERMRLGRDEYEALRANPMRFAVLPGHDDPEAERVVERRGGYLVVEKHEEARAIVEGTDPRR